VTQALLHYLRVHALSEEQCGTGLPQVVKTVGGSPAPRSSGRNDLRMRLLFRIDPPSVSEGHHDATGELASINGKRYGARRRAIVEAGKRCRIAINPALMGGT